MGQQNETPHEIIMTMARPDNANTLPSHAVCRRSGSGRITRRRKQSTRFRTRLTVIACNYKLLNDSTGISYANASRDDSETIANIPVQN